MGTTTGTKTLTFPDNGDTGWYTTYVTYAQQITDYFDSLELVADLDLNGKGFDDSNGNEMITFTETGSAVNNLHIANAAAGNDVVLSAVGDDTNIDLALTPKAAGNLVLDGLSWPNADGSANNFLKTDGAGALSFDVPALNDLSDLTITGASKGDIVVYNGSAWVDLTVGSNGQVLSANSAQATGLEWSSAGAGEANTGSNVNVAGVGVFKQKTGTDLEFKGINAGSSKITVSDDTGNNEIDIDVAEANLTLDNLGGTLAISKGGTGQTTQTAAMEALSPSTTKGDVLVDDGTNVVRLAVGSDDQVLTADSAQSAGVKWAAVAGGAWELISTATASSDATIDFTGLTSSYSLYRIIIIDLIPATNNADLQLRMGTGAGPTWDTGNNYDYMYAKNAPSFSWTEREGASGSSIEMFDTAGNASNETLNARLDVFAPGNSNYTYADYVVTTYDTKIFSTQGGNGVYASTTAVTGLRLYMDSGNITSGSFYLYGLKNS